MCIRDRYGNPVQQGPTHQADYVIPQSPHVDSDGDGIPDAYEIGADGKAKPGFNPLIANGDSDGDGLSDLIELLQGTDPFTVRKCLSGINANQICSEDLDCEPGGSCASICTGGSNPGSVCTGNVDCTGGGVCGDGQVVNPPGQYTLSGTAVNGSPIPVSYTHLRAHETPEHLVCRLLLEK